MNENKNLKTLFIKPLGSKQPNSTQPCCMSHDHASSPLHVSIWVTAHGRVVFPHGCVSFTETLLGLCTPVSFHPHSSSLTHARASKPHGRAWHQKSPSLDFHHPNGSQYAPWRQTHIISLKIHQINSNYSSKHAELLYKITLYQCSLSGGSS